MSGVKHTPGPWEHWGDLVSVAEPQIGAGNIICVEPPTERSAANWPANARLIAAAPDLLGALESLVENLIHGDFISETRISAAVDAIALARGEQDGGAS